MVAKTVMKTIITLVTTAFGETLVGTGDALGGLFIYAIIVTILAVVVTIILARMAAKMGIEVDDEV